MNSKQIIIHLFVSVCSPRDAVHGHPQPCNTVYSHLKALIKVAIFTVLLWLVVFC